MWKNEKNKRHIYIGEPDENKINAYECEGLVGARVSIEMKKQSIWVCTCSRATYTIERARKWHAKIASIRFSVSVPFSFPFFFFTSSLFLSVSSFSLSFWWIAHLQHFHHTFRILHIMAFMCIYSVCLFFEYFFLFHSS